LDRLVVPVSCDGVKHERVGFTFLIINNSENVFVIATGSRKAKILNKILIKKEYLPAAHLSPKNNVVDYFIDKEAARELPYLESYSDHDDHILMVIE
jgi:6-phosphogluconolactonase/glucosamine-6-phosphate isomerase/deaminase